VEATVKITIFGMGYVGTVSAACLLRDGHEVAGVDPVDSKIRDLQNGRAPMQEPGVAELLSAGHRDGRLTAATDPAQALPDSDMVWICVGTPSSPDGGIDLSSVETACRQIGEFARAAASHPLIVLRSTCLPGTTRSRLIPTLEKASHLTVGRDMHVVFHPEFLREGSAVEDFDHPPKIVIGEAQPGAGDTLMDIYGNYAAPRFRLGLEEAELVKYCDNLFHAVKVTFANEVGALARDAGVDARKVAEAFCADTKLNISPRYLRPGFAFGGSCLPKDLRAILRHASLRSVRLPMLEAVPESNRQQVEALIARVLAHQPEQVGMVGLAFKANTDDMRESPYMTVGKRLIGEGLKLRIYDRGVQPERLVGSNKRAVRAALGHLESLLVSSLDDLETCDLIIINHRTVDAARVGRWLDAQIRVIDLAGIDGLAPGTAGYEGIAW
jgi:GDP-mannose 6-dehydrogenase